MSQSTPALLAPRYKLLPLATNRKLGIFCGRQLISSYILWTTYDGVELQLKLGEDIFMMKSLEFKPGVATEEAAKSIFEFLKIQKIELRYSANYPPEESYFKGTAGEIEVKIYAIDYSDVSTHCFSISSLKPIEPKLVANLIQFLEDMHWMPQSDQ